MERLHIFRTDLREVLGFLKHQKDKEKRKQYVDENEAFRHMKEDAFDVLCMYSDGRELAIRKAEYQTKGGVDMCTALRELKEEGREEGRAEMKEQIIKERAALNILIYFLINEGRIEDLRRASTDSEYQNQLLEDHGIKN